MLCGVVGEVTGIATHGSLIKNELPRPNRGVQWDVNMAPNSPRVLGRVAVNGHSG